MQGVRADCRETPDVAAEDFGCDRFPDRDFEPGALRCSRRDVTEATQDRDAEATCRAATGEAPVCRHDLPYTQPYTLMSSRVMAPRARGERLGLTMVRKIWTKSTPGLRADEVARLPRHLGQERVHGWSGRLYLRGKKWSRRESNPRPLECDRL